MQIFSNCLEQMSSPSDSLSGITKSCTHLDLAPSTSTQFISAFTQLSITPSTLLEPKFRT